VITPRRTRLVRVADLHAFRYSLVRLSLGGDPGRHASRLVIVPTQGAARQFRRTMLTAGGILGTPDLVTREELYERLRARLANPPRVLSSYERDVMIRAAAREASTEPRPLRPGLVVEILRFYDELRRHARTTRRFEELLEDTLVGVAEDDRGAARMLAQTRFLAATFRGYEQRVLSSGACDEHTLRDRLASELALDPVRHVIVTIGDWIADPDGLHLADFDLLTRLPGAEAIDVVSTNGLLASGFHQRIHDWLPGIEEVAGRDLGAFEKPEGGSESDLGGSERTRPTNERYVGRVLVDPAAVLVDPATRRPMLAVPAGDSERPVFVHRDREEELFALVRHVVVDGRARDALDRVAVVYKRPLPYLYLAPVVCGGVRIPYQSADGFPLAAEPFAAALDLVFEFVASGFTRRSIVALLGSPHFVFEHEGRPIGADAVAALDRGLSQRRYLGGGLDRLVALAATWRGGDLARPVLAAACAAAEHLSPLLLPGPASAALRVLLAFIDTYGNPVDVRLKADTTKNEYGSPIEARLKAPPTDDNNRSRLLRARAAIRELLESLADAHVAHDDPAMAIADLSASVRRFLEEQTLLPEPGEAGVQFVDDQAARYGEFDEIAVVGLIEGEWPERPRRNIFYPPSLLMPLGWPLELDRRAAAEARFVELIASASHRVTVSTVTLEDDALVEPSSFVESVSRAHLEIMRPGPQPPGHAQSPSAVFADEVLSVDPASLMKSEALDPDAREWLLMRLARSSRDDPAFHGQAGPIGLRTWSVSALETYLECPFRFFAQHVLRLDEEPEDEEVMNPRTRGAFVHDVFQAFFERWQAEGHQAIAPDNLEAARRIFTTVVDERLTKLADAEASLERARLLGGPTAAGLGETVLRMEAERPVAVIGRLLEHRLDGEFVFQTGAGPRRLALRGKADRVDLLDDGTFRLIDYKLGWPPDRTTALQLPVYGLCLEQRLGGYLGRTWTLGEAAYVAFRGPKRFVPLLADRGDREKVLAAAQDRLLATADAVSRGDFPPRPDDVFRCEACSYSTVCRKDYVGDI